MKSVMIPEKLFLELVRYHLVSAETADTAYIRRELEDKVNRMVEHNRYTQSLVGDKETPR